MFTLNLSKTFKYPVKFAVVDEAGHSQTYEISAVFKRLTVTAFQAMLDANDARRKARGQGDNAIDPLRDETDAVLAFVDGWDGVMDESGDALTFNPDNLKAVLDAVPGLGAALFDAFMDARNGGQQRKN